MVRGSVAAVAVLLSVSFTMTGCEGIREHVRSKDFRDRSPEARPTGTPSPIANVADMPGWTTEIDTAIAFATENPQNTVVFMQQSGNPQTEALKKLLVSTEVENALSNKQKVTLNMATDADIAARYGIRQAPAVVIVGPGGVPAAQKAGRISKSELLSLVK